MMISISLNLVLGIICLKLKSYGGINQVLNHIYRIFSGALVPISFFPTGIRQIITFLPFPFAVSFPTLLLTKNQFEYDPVLLVLVSILWGILTLAVTFYLWNKLLKTYEATGI